MLIFAQLSSPVHLDRSMSDCLRQPAPLMFPFLALCSNTGNTQQPGFRLTSQIRFKILTWQQRAVDLSGSWSSCLPTAMLSTEATSPLTHFTLQSKRSLTLMELTFVSYIISPKSFILKIHTTSNLIQDFTSFLAYIFLSIFSVVIAIIFFEL